MQKPSYTKGIHKDFFFVLATPCGMWDLAVPPALRAWSLNHWTPGKSQDLIHSP